ncbi:hypothetical protein EW146_g7122, partial [Bondarzewia mesenterica]
MGVKSLWSLLTPVGRPALLETMEGKAMAIDSSIWIYQFQATMRDKEGRALVNAHVLGFLRRICKLLFYGIKPVFVFDGGAPALKRATITERKKKKSGAAASHAKVAERLLAAQLRRAALDHAQQQQSKGKGKGPAEPVTIDENTVYLEDIDTSLPKTPARKIMKDKTQGPSPSSSSKKNRWHDHDPYRLPEVNLEERVASVTRSAAPDPRLATEEELQAFIDEMRPEDFDVTSPAFRELPTEVQYEIIGDLRLKSRQTSYKRLQTMLKKSRTPLDFSKQQIKNLQQRNVLTQQLLVTTDTIGQAHVSIPVRIASERNREYVLMKNEGAEGGWVLGIRDEGTRSKPIHIDHEEEVKQQDDDSDMDMEEVDMPQPGAVDPDLREYQREMALSAITRRRDSKVIPSTKKHLKKQKQKQKVQPLFDLDDDYELPQTIPDNVDEDPELAIAMQESIDLEEEAALRRALEASRMAIAGQPSTEATSTSDSLEALDHYIRQASDDDDLYVPGRLETALAIANAGPAPTALYKSSNTFAESSMWQPTKLLTAGANLSAPTSLTQKTIAPDSEDDMEEIVIESAMTTMTSSKALESLSSLKVPQTPPKPVPAVTPVTPTYTPASDSEDDMEEIIPAGELPFMPSEAAHKPFDDATIRKPVSKSTPSSGSDDLEYLSVSEGIRAQIHHPTPQKPDVLIPSLPKPSSPSRNITPVSPPNDTRRLADHFGSDEEAFTDWSRSPSPVQGRSLADDGGSESQRSRRADENWDAAQEMDPNAEEGEFARFVSQVKGKDIDAVRREIDEEIKTLNQQKKTAMRDSEDVTQHMISQIMIMLRLFGIPYITAPMEAEAQCAALVQLGLVEGIITDDSDVFLFGGLRVFKNMFNQSKTVECFLLSDLGRELGLARDKLVQLAYLLGSDYVEGLPGVGPVVAMELLKEFPGNDGLHKFKDWWQKVQSGKDKQEDSKSKFRQRFKKKFKDLYLPDDWPNPAVRNAYYHPTVDESEEPFKWGLPDLDGLRNFFLEELGWSQSKVEELLLPIIQKMNKRGQAQALNRQGNLNEYFEVTVGDGAFAPRKRNAYASKRLQQVVNDFRNEQAKLRKSGSASAGSSSTSPAPDAPASSESEEEDEYQGSAGESKSKGKGK